MPLIGVSIAVPDPCGRELQDYRVALGDDDAQKIPTHITLVPPTELHGERLLDVADHLAAAASEHGPFGLRLRGTGSFRPVSPVVFMGVTDGMSECELLAKSIRTGPLETNLEFPYYPHVTIAHDLPDAILDRALAELAGKECRFEVSRFWLYVFDQGAGWVPERQFVLGL